MALRTLGNYIIKFNARTSWRRSPLHQRCTCLTRYALTESMLECSLPDVLDYKHRSDIITVNIH